MLPVKRRCASFLLETLSILLGILFFLRFFAELLIPLHSAATALNGRLMIHTIPFASHGRIGITIIKMISSPIVIIRYFSQLKPSLPISAGGVPSLMMSIGSDTAGMTV